ncbi:MAG: heat-inducible transcription repressor HrcA [Chloroflexi bacterium]|nr:heat-inducible transcription repressor HrcA [Chloroflexota bacterium]
MTTSKFEKGPENPPAKKKAGRPRKNVEIIGPSGESGDDGSRLSDRQRAILRIIIQEFITTAAPVSSEAIVNKYGLPYSPATVRNEMAELEQGGYISHPHTSAGRIPSDLGYRYYVEHLMERRSGLSPVEQNTIQHQFYQLQMEFTEWLRLAASVTANTAHNAALVSTPRVYDNRLKYVQLIGVQERAVLLVIVTQDGSVKEQMLTLEDPVTQNELTQVTNRLNTLLSNLNRPKMEARIKDWPDDLTKFVAGRMVETFKALDRYKDAQIYRDGLVNILNQPEFSDIGRVRHVVQVIENGQTITSIIPEVLSSDGNAVQVIIGGDNRFDDLRLLSVVLARYGIDGQMAGVVGIVGPTRMEYNRSISTVQYIANLLSGLVTERRG